MASRINQRQMEFLSTSLKPSTSKKKAKTQGKIVPVMKKSNPYKQVTPKKPNVIAQNTAASANQQGAAAQGRAIEQRAPVSTQLNVSYESDPVLARIKAIGGQDVANARSEAEALRKKAIIDSGLSDVGAEIGLDPATVQAAAANPFSTRANLEHEAMQRGQELDTQLNQQNLFYSGHRADQLGELERNRAQAQTGLQGDIRSLLGSINSGVTSAEQAAALQEQQALEQVAEQERQAALEQSYLDALYPPAPTGNIQDYFGTPTPTFSNPYDIIDPYEEELARVLGMNAVPGAAPRYA